MHITRRLISSRDIHAINQEVRRRVYEGRAMVIRGLCMPNSVINEPIINVSPTVVRKEIDWGQPVGPIRYPQEAVKVGFLVCSCWLHIHI